jgi:hypothetical protein
VCARPRACACERACVRVCSALVIHYAKRMRRVVLSSVVFLALIIFVLIIS